MSTKILLAYATRYGSTQEVANTIAGSLRKQGITVDMLPAKLVKSLQGYQALVLGAPLFMFHWHADALGLLARQRMALERLPVAIFTPGPFHNKEDEIATARELLDKALAKFPWLKPVATTIFVGKFDPDRLGFPLNLFGGLRDMPFSDERDWPTIEAWADGLVALLPAPHQAVV